MSALPPAARQALVSGAAALGLVLDEAQLALFDRYAALLAEGRRAFNLTALIDPSAVAIKHFFDSLTVATALPPGPLRLIDVGTGAGFPGLPLKILRRELRVTLVEATAKKAIWLEQTAAALELDGVAAVAGRAEELARDPAHRGRYDAAVARALAPLPVIAELCLPFLRPGGRLVAQKSAAGAAAERAAGEAALRLLGAELHEIRPVDSPLLPNRVLVIAEQVRPAPPAYPRRSGMPAKRPIEPGR